MRIPLYTIPLMTLALASASFAHASSSRFLRQRDDETKISALKDTETQGYLITAPLDNTVGLKEEDGSYWSRLLEETVGMSVAPTPTPPSPPTTSPPTISAVTPPPTPPPSSSTPAPQEPTPSPPVAPLTPTPTAPQDPTPRPPIAPVAPATPPAVVPTAAPVAPTAPMAPVIPPPSTSMPATPTADQSIAAILAADGRFTKLVSLADGADLIPPLMNAGPLTVFAPTDAAFDALGLNPDATDPIIISTLLLYHVAAGIVPLEDGLGVETLNGRSVILTVTETETKVNEANIVETIPASNGVIYVIDAVLIPPTNPPSTTP